METAGWVWYTVGVSDYRNLRVWAAADDLAILAYEMTRRFPPAELYGLTSQIRRAAVSIPANLAEGSGRHSDRDFVRFVRIATGSASEVEYLAHLAARLGLLTAVEAEQIESQAVEVRRMLAGLMRSLTK